MEGNIFRYGYVNIYTYCKDMCNTQIFWKRYVGKGVKKILDIWFSFSFCLCLAKSYEKRKKWLVSNTEYFLEVRNYRLKVRSIKLWVKISKVIKTESKKIAAILITREWKKKTNGIVLSREGNRH